MVERLDYQERRKLKLIPMKNLIENLRFNILENDKQLALEILEEIELRLS